MDALAPLVTHLSPTVKSYYSGRTCEGGFLDGSAPVGHLHVIRSGRLSVQLPQGREMVIEEPTVLLFPKACAHGFRPDPQGVELVCGTIAWHGDRNSSLINAWPQVIAIALDRMPGIRGTLDLMYDEAFGDKVGRQLALDRLFEYFFIQVLRHLIQQDQLNLGALAAMSDPRLALAFEAMHARPAHPWTLDELAHIAGMSRSRFAATFRAMSGVTVLDYLTDWRMASARQQLSRGRPLKAVANAVGYQSPEALTKVFLRKVGKTPAQWLRGLDPD